MTVGRLRQQLAKAIVQTFANEGVMVRCDPAKLYPAEGRWRSDFRMDVMRWEGSIEVKIDGGGWLRLSIGSWDTMTACVKGFSVWRDGVGFEVAAAEPGCSSAERYVLED